LGSIPSRRLALFLEESIYRGTQWTVFEPNDEALWSPLRLSIRSFMANLYRVGAFYGYQVTWDRTTATPSDIAQGIVRMVVGFSLPSAPQSS
jgi:phage tail sheath protein FI